jgi:hypothetical protein
MRASEEEFMHARLAAVSVFRVGMLLIVAQFALTHAASALDGGCSLATLRGPYAVYGQGTVFVGTPPQPGLEVDIGIATLDGKGNLSGSLTFSFNGQIFRTKFIGAYLVNSDCTISLTTQDDLGEHLQQEGVVISGDEFRVIGTDPGRVIARVAQRLH